MYKILNILKRITTALSTVDETKAIVTSIETQLKALVNGEMEAMRTALDTESRSRVEIIYATVNILDHVAALHYAAVKSASPGVVSKITQFKNQCFEFASRAGLSPIVTGAGEPFNSEIHALENKSERAPDTATVASSLAPGFTLQGKLLRRELVTLRKSAGI